ncbi:histidine kinase [Pelomonas sp. KK5]|uniref:histidine kinase n=1 Tax=Pelomonas sp. KK5 TaxID=1855730 RepID=UPI00097BF9E6|nr:histidine kinase [Pelomonas sp. KK5]
MTLRSRINLIVASLTILFVAAILGLQLRSMRESVHEEVVAANLVAMQLLQRNAMLYGAQGMPAILAYLQGVGRVRSNDIVLYDEQDHVIYRSPPSRYKAGRDAPDWFDALIAPPPSVQSIAFPGGRLVTESNASRATIDAWDYMVVLCGGAAVMLLVVNALVFWLVGRTARPFAQIAGALDEVEAGRLDVALPPLPGTEARLIGAAFNRMVGRLRANLETERRLADNRELTRWLEAELEQERRRIARELHDELGQSVTAMHSMAVSIVQRVQGIDPQAEQAARLIADESSRLYDAMHGIVPRLAPPVLDALGLTEALADLVERTRRSQEGITLNLDVQLGEAALAPDPALALYRGAQEGVTNALRHGQASRIDIALRREDGRVLLQLRDNGRGLPDEPRPAAGHHGLRWLAERAEGLGGTLATARRGDGPGTELRMELPA